MFLTKEDQERLQETYLEGPASIVFEILSKSTRNDDISKKLPAYLASGVKEAWIIDPENETISIHWTDGEEDYTGNSRATSIILPGFWIRGSWLWTPDAMPVMSALDEIEKSDQ